MGGVHGFDWTSSAVTLMPKLPIMPRYAPVPEPATTGTWVPQLGSVLIGEFAV